MGNNIKMNVNWIVCEDIDCVHQTHVKYQSCVNVKEISGVLLKMNNFLTIWEIANLSRILSYGASYKYRNIVSSRRFYFI